MKHTVGYTEVYGIINICSLHVTVIVITEFDCTITNLLSNKKDR
jgi:hypothetical protein